MAFFGEWSITQTLAPDELRAARRKGRVHAPPDPRGLLEEIIASSERGRDFLSGVDNANPREQVGQMAFRSMERTKAWLYDHKSLRSQDGVPSTPPDGGLRLGSRGQRTRRCHR